MLQLTLKSAFMAFLSLSMLGFTSSRQARWSPQPCMGDQEDFPHCTLQASHRGRRVLDHTGSEIPRADTISLSTGGGPSCLTDRGKAFCWAVPTADVFLEDWLNTALLSNIDAEAEDETGLTDVIANGTAVPISGPEIPKPVVVDTGAGAPGLVSPKMPQLPGSWLQISRGIGHGCGIKKDLQVACFGAGTSGQLGNGQLLDLDKAVDVVSTELFISVSVGKDHSCGVTVSSRAFCWGSNEWGQLGDGTQTSRSTPVEVGGNLTTWQTISAGNQYTCATRPGEQSFSEAFCFGRDSQGQIGHGALGEHIDERDTSVHVLPSLIPGNHSWHVLSAGYATVCGITAVRELYCWGANTKGLLGANVTSDSFIPLQVAPGKTWETISVGRAHACGIITGGSIECWGLNVYGQLGDKTTLDRAYPAPISSNDTWIDVAVGAMHSCGVRSDGSLECWGYSDNNGGSSVPVTVALSESDSGGSSTTAAVIAVSVIAGVVLLGLIALFVVKRRNKQSSEPVSAFAAKPVGEGTGLARLARKTVRFLDSSFKNTQYTSPPELEVNEPSAAEPSSNVLPLSAARSGSLPSVDNDSLYSLTRAHSGATATPSMANSQTSGGLTSASFGLMRTISLGRTLSLGTTNEALLDVGDTPPWQFAYGEMTIKCVLGSGSFGKVYLVMWHETEVALKTLAESKQGITLTAEILHGKLAQEAALMAQLRHPNCVQFLGFCDDPPCIASEYCSRGSLYNILQNAGGSPIAAKDLPWKRRLQMALDAAKGMLYLHTRKPAIVHRDLKSPNLLVTNDWRIKVADFNLSKLVANSAVDGSLSAEFANNPRWASPEVMEGKTATPASDVFSFGVVMWELLTWETPWANGAHFMIANQVMARNRLAIPEKKDLPGANMESAPGLDSFIELLQQCWAQNPADRPNFQEIIHRLRSLTEN